MIFFENECSICGARMGTVGDKIPLCHECYTNLMDVTKKIDDKIEYLQSVKNRMEA